MAQREPRCQHVAPLRVIDGRSATDARTAMLDELDLHLSTITNR